MRVLVTGGTSLLGSAVAKRLSAQNQDVVLFQRSPSGLDVEEHLGDITDNAAVDDAAAGCDAVVHLAARVSIVGDWEAFEKVNISGTENLLAAARKADATRFIHISTPSAAHVGDAIVGGLAERADPERARGHYAKSKASAELLALDQSSKDFSVVAIRPHLVWGPGDTQLVGRMVDRARSGRLGMIGGGLALIDTTYIDNAADAIVAALDRASAVSGRRFVVSNGEPRTVFELIGRILEAAGLPMPGLEVPTEVAKAGGWVVDQLWGRLGGAEEPPITGFLVEQLTTAHWFDQRETQAALHWKPAISLEEGFRRLSDWFRSEGRGADA